jgi:hypothetical protein
MTTIAASHPAIQAAALRGEAVASGMVAILAQRRAQPGSGAVAFPAGSEKAK